MQQKWGKVITHEEAFLPSPVPQAELKSTTTWHDFSEEGCKANTQNSPSSQTSLKRIPTSICSLVDNLAVRVGSRSMSVPLICGLLFILPTISAKYHQRFDRKEFNEFSKQYIQLYTAGDPANGIGKYHQQLKTGLRIHQRPPVL